MNITEAVMNEAKRYEMEVSTEAADLIAKHFELLLQWNERCHLTTITEPSESAKRHYLESLIALELAEVPESARWLDVGTGGGFPGMAVKFFCAGLEIHLLDSKKRKALFLKEVAAKIGINDIKVHDCRAKELLLQEDCVNYFDVISLKAVGKTLEIMKSVLPALKKEGKYILFAGNELFKAVEESPDWIIEKSMPIAWAKATWVLRVGAALHCSK